MSLMAAALLAAVLVLFAHAVLMVLVMRRPGPPGPQGPPGPPGLDVTSRRKVPTSRGGASR